MIFEYFVYLVVCTHNAKEDQISQFNLSVDHARFEKLKSAIQTKMEETPAILIAVPTIKLIDRYGGQVQLLNK